MRRESFEKYLLAYLKESTVNEKVSKCSSIEKKFAKNLDVVAASKIESDALLDSVSKMKNPRKYEIALMEYFDFARENHCSSASYWEPMSQHFYRISDDMPSSHYFNIIPAMEREYECILAFGRDEFFRKAS